MSRRPYRLPIVPALAVLCTLAVPVDAADAPSLGAKFDEAVAGIGERCEKAEAKALLVLARPDADFDEPPNDLVDALFAAVREGLAKSKAELVVARCDTAADDSPVESAAERVLTPREIDALGEVYEFDLVLDATYRVTRGKPTLRVALFDGHRRLALQHVSLGEERLAAATEFRRRNPTPAFGVGGLRRATAGTAGGSRRRGVSAIASSSSAAGAPLPPRRRRDAEGPNGKGTPGDGSRGDNPPGEDARTPEVPADPKPPGGTEAVGLNKGVLDFAQRNFGQQVGNGECWTLANEALIAAGAKRAQGYAFGRSIPLGDVTPGDVLQFKNVRLERGNRYWTLGMPNHTAIVEAAEGTVVTVLHQNFGTRTVTRLTFDFADMKQGEVTAFRPVK